jgi:hypothetical protein
LSAEAGWPDWSTFRPLSDCLLWAFIFFKLAHFEELLFSTVKDVHWFERKMGWAKYIMDDYFRELIWSHCSQDCFAMTSYSLTIDVFSRLNKTIVLSCFLISCCR